MKAYPAIDVRTDAPDLLLAIVDDFGPTAVADGERAGFVRLFFFSADARDRARTTLASRFDVFAVDVPDEDWARRSQENLTPVTVGRITVFPSPESRTSNAGEIALVVVPSMGFGTGHHVTTNHATSLVAWQVAPLLHHTNRSFRDPQNARSGLLGELGGIRNETLGAKHEWPAWVNRQESLHGLLG